MATQIQIKRGSTTPAGLTVGESAMNTSTNQIYLGGTGGTVLVGGEVTGGVDMGAGSAVSANRIPTQSGVYNYVRNSTVTSFNGRTGAVTGASLGANTFTELNTFNAGVSASALTVSGGVTFSGNLTTTGSLTTLGEGASFVLSGITSYNNDRVAIVGDYYESAFTTLTGSTTGIIATFSGTNNIKVTVNCFGTIFANVYSKTHVFNISCNQGEYGVTSFDYTESILGSSWSGVVFTMSTVTNGFSQIMAITASTPALEKFQSSFGFETSIVRVSV